MNRRRILDTSTRETAASPAGPLVDDLFANPAVGLMLLSHDAHIVRAGNGLCNLLGYEEEEIVGYHLTDIIHPDDRLSAQLAVMALQSAADPTRTVERRYLRKDGSIVWIIASVSKLPGVPTPGAPVYVAQITPIDRQKQAEAAVAEALERWSFALDGARQGVWDINLDTGAWFFSAAWRQMRGIPADEPVPDSDEQWLESIHPDDRERVADILARQNAGELVEIAYEYRERHRDGHWIWIMARGRCLEWTSDGMARRLIGTDTDITEIKQREHKFANISNRLKLALSASKIGIWETDVDTLVPEWDARTREIFGCDVRQMPDPDLAWASLVHPEDREAALDIANRALEQGTDYTCDYRIVRPDGGIRHVRTSATFSIDANNRSKLIGINWDMTAEVERNEELEAARAEMEHVSLHDSLTGLPNRRCLDQALSNFDEPSGKQDGLVLLHIDLDRFKQINDTKGHAAGDAMLVHMANLLKSILGEDAMVARIGGDEFVVMLSPAPSRPRLQALVDEIIARANVPMIWEGHQCRTGASIGIAEAKGDFDPRQLLVNADIALYRAKNLGRKCAAYFSDELQAEIIASKQCGDDILGGLERGEFIPYYQPQFDAATLDIAGVEALARWRHPVRGLLTPDKFLPVAYEINAVSAIDRAILEQTLADLERWNAAGLAVPKASVNVSARRLSDENLIASLQSLAIQPGRIAFELLESIFLDERDEAISSNIAALKDLGIDIVIDDFGTGYASIVSLLQLRPSQMKIDRQLVGPIIDSEQQLRLVRSIVEIGKSQGVGVCAEGVEEAEHVRILRGLGCDCLQGFFFGRPSAADDLVEIVRGESWRKALDV